MLITSQIFRALSRLSKPNAVHFKRRFTATNDINEQEKLQRSELYEKHMRFYRSNYIDKINYELLEDFPEWLDGIGLKILTPYFEGMRWEEIIKLSMMDLYLLGIRNSKVRTLLVKHFWKVKNMMAKDKGGNLGPSEIRKRINDFTRAGHDLAVDPYLLSVDYAYASFEPFFHGKKWQDIVEMNAWDLKAIGIRNDGLRRKMVWNLREFKKAMVHADNDFALINEEL
ncbi:2140_t:CDS:2 [Acaulospora morrowiae]|uniref:2140_t:CDS:1 n=1 Tax=Acaulospora morrowiae TaxID=94023 RepID=A0A9N8VTK4_9GLOM|nr:2140_t:CDS:2 [Acaulospora morrowiae]